MISITLCTLLLITASACNAGSSRIIGGEITLISYFPSIVQVENRVGLIWSQSCAASILNTRYVVSAAQCFDLLLSVNRNRRIRAGTTSRNSGGIVVNIVRAIHHPSYNPRSHDGDICVVELETPLTYNEHIQRVPLIARNYVVPDDSVVTLAGWGSTRRGGSASSVLRKVDVLTINNEECARRYRGLYWPNTNVNRNMICAGNLDVGDKDFCDGDIGGPMYYQDTLVGIMSWSYRCAHSTYPGVSTNVAAYTDWIIATAV